MIIYLPLLLAIIGLVVYMTTTVNAKLAEVGRLTYWVGLLVFLGTGGQQLIHVIK